MVKKRQQIDNSLIIVAMVAIIGVVVLTMNSNNNIASGKGSGTDIGWSASSSSCPNCSEQGYDCGGTDNTCYQDLQNPCDQSCWNLDECWPMGQENCGTSPFYPHGRCICAGYECGTPTKCVASTNPGSAIPGCWNPDPSCTCEDGEGATRCLPEKQRFLK